MHAEDRVIHFSTELMHPPAQHAKASLQRLYFELSKTRASFDGSDFTTPGQGTFFSRRGERSQSLGLFLPDRMAFIEEWADLPMQDFLAKVREALPVALDVLAVPAVHLQVVTLRSTLVPSHYRDARVFLVDRVCNQEGRLGPYLKRPIGIGGFRLVLPETPQSRGTIHLAIESFRHDPREVLVEVKALYNDPLKSADKVGAVLQNIQATRAFIVECVQPFLEQYDVPQEAP